MPPFIVLTILIVVVVLVAKSIHDARKGSEASPRPKPSRAPRPPRAQARPARPTKPVDQAALAEHVTKLREAIAGGLVTTEEAVASICRFTEGALSEEAARELLRRQGAA